MIDNRKIKIYLYGCYVDFDTIFGVPVRDNHALLRIIGQHDCFNFRYEIEAEVLKKYSQKGTAIPIWDPKYEIKIVSKCLE